MSKAIGKTLKILAVVTVAAVFAVSVVVSGGASLAIAAKVTAALVGKAALAAYTIGSALDPPSLSATTANFKNQQGSTLTLTADPAASRWHMLGEAATAGNLMFRDTVGADNEDLWMVIELAGHPSNTLTSFEWDGEIISFISNNAVGKYNNKMYMWFMDGDEAQSAHTELVAASSKWSSTDRARGVTYAVVKLIADTDLFQSGVQQMRFVFKGADAYDPRLDTTRTDVGGAGSHRVDDQSTWEWSDNPALLCARYLYGFKINGILAYGKGVADARISWVDVAAAADACDELVDLKAGGTEKRYTLNGAHNPTPSHNTNISILASSMAGMVYQSSGKWRMQAGVPRIATKTRSTDDFIGPIKSRGQRDPITKYNAVRGLFPDASQRYEAVGYPLLKLDSELTADGEQDHLLSLNLPFTSSGTMAQRISKINLMRTRMNRTANITLNAIGLEDGAADTIYINHPALNLNSMKMRLEKWQFRFVQIDEGMGFIIHEDLTEEDDTLIYSWDETTEEQTPVSGGTINRYDKEPIPTSAISLGAGEFFAVEAGADKTSIHTAADTSQVDGIAAATVQGGAAKADLGLDASGDLIRDILLARANSSDLLRYASGALYTGALAATENTGALADLDTVAAAQIAANAVITAKINALAVTTGKLNTDAVTNAKIAALAVDTPELAVDAVETVKVLDEAISATDSVLIVIPFTASEITVTTGSSTHTIMSESFTVQKALVPIRVSGVASVGWVGNVNSSTSCGGYLQLELWIDGSLIQLHYAPPATWTSTTERARNNINIIAIPFDATYIPGSTGAKTVELKAIYYRAGATNTLKVEPWAGTRVINWQEVKK